jgi:hypothetical protein
LAALVPNLGICMFDRGGANGRDQRNLAVGARIIE